MAPASTLSPTVPGAADTSVVVVARAELRWQSSRSATAAVQTDLAAAEQLVTTRTADLKGALERHPQVAHTDQDTLARGVAAARSRLEQTSAEVARLGDVETRLARAHTVRQSLVVNVEELERTPPQPPARRPRWRNGWTSRPPPEPGC